MTVKKELIITAKTVEEARKKAAAELNVEEEALTITVLDEGKKGFLGIGSCDAKISATYVYGGDERALAFVKNSFPT
jgi:predicted RNA-binding protein Jag